MAINHEALEAARRRMLDAQRALMQYEEHLKTNPSDRKRFNQLYSRVRVCTEEYLSLIMTHFQAQYAENESTSEEPPESETA